MKKLYFMFIIFAFCGISIFGDNAAREEVDFLLFSPNSGNQFENEEQASIQLDKLARYLSNKNLAPGQIIIYGYAAYAPNDIKSLDLSKERAVFVMNELQKRGISKELFSEPIGYGEVYQWGNNTDENARKPNRRVRVLLDGESPTPITHEIITAETEATEVETPTEEASDIFPDKLDEPEYTQKRASLDILWLLLPLLVMLAAIIIFILLNTRSRKTALEGKPAKAEPPAPQTVIVPKPTAVNEPTPIKAAATWTVNLDEEIRYRAYEIYQRRNEQGDYRDQDWYNAVREISAKYESCGHSVFLDGGCWWASRSYNW